MSETETELRDALEEISRLKRVNLELQVCLAHTPNTEHH